MRFTRPLILLLMICLVSCTTRPLVVTPTLPVATQVPQATSTTGTALPSATAVPVKPATQPPPTASPTTAPTLPLGVTPLPATPLPPNPVDNPPVQGVDFSLPSVSPFTAPALKTYQPAPYPDGPDALPLNMDSLANPAVIQGLTEAQKTFLVQNGFVVLPSGDKQFKDIRRSVSTVHGQPYYLTTDAAYHALHTTFNDLLEALEREYLRPALSRLLQAEFEQIAGYANAVKGQPLAADAQLAQAYLAVAFRLLYPDAPALDANVEAKIAPQITQIMAYGGQQKSALIPGFTDDYGAYRPVGHYAGKPELESYFRAMTWLGRVNFFFKNADTPDLQPSRAPLLITLALREAQVDGLPAYRVWTELYQILDFMVGPSDDPGPLELNALMQTVYGADLGLAALADDARWQVFLAHADELPAPRIESTFASSSSTQQSQRGWRFMGQRFTLDGFIFQNLIFDKVGTNENPRGFPSGLDVAAAFGSKPAQQALDTAGATQYAHYIDQMALVQKLVNEQPEAQWLNRFYTAWLYAFRPQAAPKDAAYPPYMRSAPWGYKEVNALLGSWAELKHDTVLYAKMPEGMGGGGPPMSAAAPAYVEPNPNVFYRLAYAAGSLYTGLQPITEDYMNRGWQEAPTNDYTYTGLNRYQEQLKRLQEAFTAFGDIAVRELKGQPLTVEDYQTIQVCLEVKECLDRGMYSQNPPEMDPIPVIAAVSGYKNDVLEAGVGDLNRIYVAVPLEGKLEIAQGGVFSYYEFTQPRTDRLTDQVWRDRLVQNPPAAPAWMSEFVLPGGKVTDSLAFRPGDVYLLTEKGYNPPLNLRAGPGKTQAVVRKLDQEEYFTIQGGPVKNADGTWWKVEIFSYDASGQKIEGWLLENQEWYARSDN